MPYAVIEEGGKQYKVEQGEVVLIELQEAGPGTEIQFGRVLLYHDGASLQVGRPLVEGVTVTGTVKGEVKGPKVVAYKFRRRKNNSHTKVGHRQKLLNVEITKIGSQA